MILRLKERRVRLGVALFVATAIQLFSPPVSAHIGSPNVFYEGDAGPYHLLVTVNVPQVIPGVADIQVRAGSADVREISTAVARLTGPGSKYVPAPDVAARSTIDPQLFTSSLWLMEYGSLRVVLKVNGARGPAEMSVPVPSFARSVLPMSRWLGAILLALTAGLALGAISIVGAAAGQATVSPGESVSARSRRRQAVAMAVMAVVVAGVFYFALAWWGADARQYAAIDQLFKPHRLSLTLSGANRLEISASASDRDWLKYKVMEKLVPDHGHLMHLFLVRLPGFDRLYHLHPEPNGRGRFADNLPAIDSGRYEVFADVVDESGFPWTLVGEIALAQISGHPMSGDDSGATAAPKSDSSETTTATLADGTRVTWERRSLPLKANVATILKFDVQSQNGTAAADLEPYMGMAAHAEIIRSDLSVFAHIHPSGSVPMASLAMASAGGGNDGASAASAMSGMAMPQQRISPEISLPYGFPKPGLYRIFLQFKRGGTIDTAVFDTQVR